MVEVINIVMAVATIVFGAIALISPSYAMQALKLQTVDGQTDGMSELRAASGGAFVGTGLLALVLAQWSPLAWVMLGAHYLGAGVGRIASIALDNSGSRKMWAFFAIEAAFAAWLIGANLTLAG